MDIIEYSKVEVQQESQVREYTFDNLFALIQYIKPDDHDEIWQKVKRVMSLHMYVKLRNAIEMYKNNKHRTDQLTTELARCEEIDSIREKPSQVNFLDIKPEQVGHIEPKEFEMKSVVSLNRSKTAINKFFKEEINKAT